MTMATTTTRHILVRLREWSGTDGLWYVHVPHNQIEIPHRPPMKYYYATSTYADDLHHKIGIGVAVGREQHRIGDEILAYPESLGWYQLADGIRLADVVPW